MRSIKFPNMFNTNNTRVWKENEYKQATLQNCVTLLHTERGELFGDPYYGLLFKHYLYSQDSYLLEDMLIDMIYTQLVLFIPQLHIDRNKILIIKDTELGKLYCRFSATSQIDYTTDTYQLVLFKSEFEE